MNLSDRVVLITGASQGIGRAAALNFAQTGSKVVLVARSKALLEQVADEAEPAQTLVLPTDVSQPDSATKIIDAVIDRFGRVDILVNNAAIGLYGPSHTASMVDVQSLMAVNFLGPLSLIQACIPAMHRQNGGLIITISSIIGRRSTPWNGAYSASKAALEHLIESLRVEQAPHNIRFSTLYPGVTQTNFVANSLGNTALRQGRVQGVSASRVADKLIRVAQKEPRDAYVTLFDWAFVAGSRLLPGFVDWLFQRYFAINS